MRRRIGPAGQMFSYMAPTTEFSQMAKSVAAPRYASASPWGGPQTSGFYVRRPANNVVVDNTPDNWLRRLGVDCATYVRNYETDPRQSEFAVDMIYNADTLAYQRTSRSGSGGGFSIIQPISAQAVARGIYNHCLIRLGRGGEAAASRGFKAAGQADAGAASAPALLGLAVGFALTYGAAYLGARQALRRR